MTTIITSTSTVITLAGSECITCSLEHLFSSGDGGREKAENHLCGGISVELSARVCQIDL